MRILFVANPNSPHTRRWVNWFARHGHTVFVAADNPLKDPWPEVTVFDLPRFFNLPGLRWLVWALCLRVLIRRWKPDILHAHRVSAAGWLAAASGFHPQVVTPWGSDLYVHPLRSTLAAWLARFCLRRADLVTADSKDLLLAAQRYGAAPARCALVQWGVDARVFRPAPASQVDRAAYQISGSPVIFSPRACKPLYNLDQIVAAFPAVRARYPQAQLILRAFEPDPAYRAALEVQVERLGLADAMRWIGQIEPWEKIAALFQLSDLAVSVPSSDGTPGSVLEAMACGVPVIASDLPSLREWITPGENGLLFDSNDPRSIAESVIAALENKNLRDKAAGLNQEIISARAEYGQNMSKAEEFYRSVTGRQ